MSNRIIISIPTGDEKPMTSKQLSQMLNYISARLIVDWGEDEILVNDWSTSNWRPDYTIKSEG